MKISHLLMLSISILFLTYAVHSYLTYDVAVKEAKSATLLRNQAQATNIMKDLDKYINNRISDFHGLTLNKQIQKAVLESNRDFDVKLINSTHAGLQLSISHDAVEKTPFLRAILENDISDELNGFITFYKNEYDYDVVNELFVTNKYGANIALGIGNSDYLQNDEDWWQMTSNKQNYLGALYYDKNYNDYVIAFAYPILDESTNYIGTIRISTNLHVLLHDFLNDADILRESNKNVMLVDNNGKIIFKDGKFYTLDEQLEYASKLVKESDSFEYGTDAPKFVSYASSIGYRDFRGYDWTVVIEQEESTILNEFEDLRNTILTSAIVGLISALVLGAVLSHFVTNPLQKLSRLTTSLGQGDFEAKTPHSKISEINSIIDSFSEMESSLKKLFETETRLAEANIRIKNERLTAIGELAASMAHDMKNPLATIRSGIDIIKRNIQLNSDLDTVIQRMDRAISRMSHQVEDVLNYVRRTPLSIKPVSITTIIKSALQSLDIPKTTQVTTDGVDVIVDCDEKKLEIVFINLLLNSLQSIEGAEGKIIIRVKTLEDKVVIDIEDNGPGVPKKIASEIFKPLVTTKQKGTGLGLASCRNIVEQHGGSILFQNNPTIFTIILPLDQK